MKKVLSLIVVVVFTASSVVFSQDKGVKVEPTKAAPSKVAPTKAEQTKMEQIKTSEGTPASKVMATTKSHECYMMKDGALMHCTGDNATPQKEAVKLRNGTVISPEGMISTSEGKESKMENGQCITLTGAIGDCEKMHAMMKENMMKKEKMGEIKQPTK